MNKIGKMFAAYFKNWSIRLPPEALRGHRPGELRAHGWFIQYQFGTSERGTFLDFYAKHRMTNDRHLRIHESGETEDLPAIWNMIIYPVNATKKQEEQANRECQQHNAAVAKEIERKDFC
jgi:hypothetical protein